MNRSTKPIRIGNTRDRSIDGLQSQREEDWDIELHCEEVQDIMGRIPSWIERWGISVIFSVVALLLLGSCLFRYPETVMAEMTLTGHSPVLPLVARSSGKLTRVMVEEGMCVEAGMVLATIENSACEADISNLMELLIRLDERPDSLYKQLSMRDGGWKLGEAQQTYTSFMNQLFEIVNYNHMNYYSQKRETMTNRINQYQKHKEHLIAQEDIALQQYYLARKGHERQEALFSKMMISPADYEQSEMKLLNSQSAWETAQSSLEQLDIQIGQMEESVLDLIREQEEKETELRHNYQRSLELLFNALEGWSLNYRITAPINGKVTFSDYWSDNQTVQAGEEVFIIVPISDEKLNGRAKLPVTRSGKVSEGQRVIVSFTNYPENEYGVVNGVVEKISLVPSESFYTVEIAFPYGLYTTYRKTLPTSHDMSATAKIVTDDTRLIERLVFPIRKMLNNK